MRHTKKAHTSGLGRSETMNNMTEEQQKNERRVRAYNRMMERVKAAVEEAGHDTLRAIDAAKEKAIELDELTREEAERIAAYLRRDLQDAGEFLANRERSEFSQWLHFDLELMEENILNAFLSVADQTKVEWERLAENALHADDYFTGEVIGMGTLECVACGKHMHFKQASPIPPCPACHGTAFRRVRAADEADEPEMDEDQDTSPED
jgi:predicted  nucleic acid-binding Zn-ribbon protein